MLNSKKVNKTMKKIYQTPAMEVYKANLGTELLQNSITKTNETAVQSRGMDANSRRSTVNEDGLRDWNINLW